MMRPQPAMRQRDPRLQAVRVAGERAARVEGTFQAPSGRMGTMTGWLRLGRFALISGRLHAIGVYTGQLRDADGASIGVGSRRQATPAEIRHGAQGTLAEIGPVEVDLLGLDVHVRPFTIGVRALVPVGPGDAPPDAGSPGEGGT